MSSQKYVMTDEEIVGLSASIKNHGFNKTYEVLKENALKTLKIKSTSHVDDCFLDMSEQFLELARNETKDELQRDSFYILSSLMRKVAYDINRYYRDNNFKSSDRFLRIVPRDDN